MNRRVITKLNRGWRAILVSTFVLASWPAVQAAPLATIFLEGRIQGTTTWSSILIAAPGNVVEYRVLADLAPVGTTNVRGTITSLANSGLQSLSLAIGQAPTDLMQVDFHPPPTTAQALRNGWGAGAGANTGALSPRTPGAWNDLRDIRPILAPGQFSALDPEVVFQGGTFTVVEYSGPIPGPPRVATISPTWGTAPGAMRINGVDQIDFDASDLAGPDPPVAFQPLLFVTIPEPSTIGLSCMGLVGLVAIVRRRSVRRH